MTFRRLVHVVPRRVPRWPFRYVMPAWLVRGPFRFWLSVVAADPDRRLAVRELLEVRNRRAPLARRRRDPLRRRRPPEAPAIADRVGLLGRLVASARPRAVLLRVSVAAEPVR